MLKLPQILHNSQFRVYYEDTDAGGVVYHANYLRFMERARTDWLDSMGLAPKSLQDRSGVIFVVKSAQLEFSKPAHLSDLISVSVELEDLGAASMRVLQHVSRNTDRIASGRFRIACLDVRRFRICRVPKMLNDRLENWKA